MSLSFNVLTPARAPLKCAFGMRRFIQKTGKVAENVAGVEGVAALVVKAAYNAGLNNLKTTASPVYGEDVWCC